MATTAWTASAGGGTEAQGGMPTYPISVKSQWFTLHADLEQTADAGAVLIAPFTSTNSGLRLVPVPAGATRLLIRAKYTTAGTAPTNPVVRIMGLDAHSTAGTLDTTTTGILRLDNADNAAAGKTLTMTVATDIGDGTNSYTNTSILDGIDLQGCAAVLALVETAAALTSGTVLLQGRFLN